MKTLYKVKWLLPGNRQVLEDAGFIVEKDSIVEILNQNELAGINFDEFKVVDFGNAVITPGFINLHAHLQYTQIGEKQPKSILNRLKRLGLYLRKLWILGKNRKSFVSWIINLIIEYLSWSGAERQESFEDGLKQVILSGATCVVQLSSEEIFFEILNASPIRSYIFLEVYADSEDSSEINFEILKEKLERLRQKSSDKTFLGISPHSLYNVHSKLWEKLADYSAKNGILIHTHFAESPEEIQWIKTGSSQINKLHDFVGCKRLKPEKTVLTPVEYLKKFRLPFKNLILAHINQLKESEYKEITELGINIAHCPRSNLILHNRTISTSAAIREFKNRIGYGTDSLYSNYDLNLLNEAKYSYESGADILTILDMLCINPAKILRLDKNIGSLEKNKQADFLVFKLKNNESYPDFIKKGQPDDIYISGVHIVENKTLKLNIKT